MEMSHEYEYEYEHTQMNQKVLRSVATAGWFRSTDLRVMSPARFLCATAVSF